MQCDSNVNMAAKGVKSKMAANMAAESYND